MNDRVPVVLESWVSHSNCMLDFLSSNRRIWVEIILYSHDIIDQFDDSFFNIWVLDNPSDADLTFSKAPPTGDERVDAVIILSEFSETTFEFLREEFSLGVQSVLICANRTKESRV